MQKTELNWISVQERLPSYPEGETPPYNPVLRCFITIYSKIPNLSAGLFQTMNSVFGIDGELPESFEEALESKQHHLYTAVADYDVNQRLWRCCMIGDMRVFNADIKELPKEAGEIVTHWAAFPAPAEFISVEFNGKTVWS